jgi:carboxyl-terminal processing protease
LEQVLKTLDNDFSGLVLDLRGNGGGLLHAAADVSDMFINSGKIVSTRIRGGEVEDRFDATAGTLVDANKPIAILIDTDSASASEIVAACLQDNQRAKIVGTRSYGKGTVQNILPLQYGRSALRLTVARYYRPNGKNIHRGKDATDDDEWGVQPDEGMEVELDEETIVDLAKRWREASYPSLGKTSNDENNDMSAQNPPDEEASNTKSSQSDSPDTNKKPTADEKPDAAGEPQNPDSQNPDSQITESQLPESDGSGDTPDAVRAEPEQKTGLELDPQLRRAVEYLKQQSSGDTKQPTTA